MDGHRSSKRAADRADDRPARSPRYRKFLRPLGIEDELRAVLRIGHTRWGQVSLFRENRALPFTPEETALVASLSAPLAEALRARARVHEDAGLGALDAPGVMTFDASGTLTSINDEARQWLDELPRSWFPRGPIDENPPNWVVATLARARAVTEERDRGAARVRLRTRSGRWLVCHASTLRDADGAIEASALVIEPAQAAEVAPIVAEAHELSRREKEVAHRGHRARAVHLDAHGARLRQGDLRQGRRLQPRRAGGQAVRRALRAAAHGARQPGRRPARGCLGTTPRAPRAGASSR